MERARRKYDSKNARDKGAISGIRGYQLCTAGHEGEDQKTSDMMDRRRVCRMASRRRARHDTAINGLAWHSIGNRRTAGSS